MGFGQEIKDFLGAATVTYKAVGSREDREYKKARAAYMRAKGDLAADPAMRDLAKRKLEAQIQKLNAGPQMHPMQQRLLQQKIDYYKANMPQEGAVPAGPASGARPTVGPQGAIDADPTYDTAALAPEDEGYSDTAYDDTLYGASGGMVTSRGKKPKAIKVKGYADGGSVEDDDVQDSYDDADNASAENSVADDVAPSEDAYDDDDAIGEVGAVSAARVDRQPKIDYEAAHDAALAGVKYSQAHHEAEAGAAGEAGSGEAEGAHEGAVPVTTEVSAASRKPAVPGGRGGARAHLSGQGAVSASEMDALKQKLDPDHKLSEDQLNMRALDEVWKWTLINQGPEAAERAAGSLTQYMRAASDRYRALYQAAAENGDVNGTVKNMARMYANVPDGRDVKFTQQDGKIKATFTDSETGKEVEKFIVSPDQLLQWATQGGAQSFDALLARSAGGRAELKDRDAKASKAEETEYKRGRDAKGDAQKERQLQAAETTAAAKADEQKMKREAPMPIPAQTALKKEIDDHIESDPEIAKAEGKALPELTAVSKQIAIKNSGSVDGPTALRVAREMTQVDPANPKRVTWNIEKDDKSGYYNVTLANGTTARIPPDSAKRLNTLRVERMAAAQAALDKATAQGARNQETGRAIAGAATNAVKGIIPAGAQPTTGPFRKDTGPRVDLYREGTPVAPAQDIDRINMARRAAGQPPITIEQLQGQ